MDSGERLNGETRVFVRRGDVVWSQEFNLWFMCRSPDGRVYACEPVVMRERAPDLATPPAATFDQHVAQGLMDSLWEAGLRPSEGSGSAGALAATERHLEDMRALVFHPMGLNPGEIAK